MISVEIFNAWGAAWFGLMARALIDTSILLALLLAVWLPFRRRVSAHLAHGLFCLILLKLIVPVPVSWSWLEPMEAFRLAAERFSPWPRPVALPSPSVATPLPLEPVVLSTTGDVGASLADASTMQPVVIAEPEVNRHKPANAAGPTALARRFALAALSFQAWLMLAWAGCTAVLLARLIGGIAKTRRLIRDAMLLRPELLPVDVEALRSAIGVRTRVRWAVNFELHSPAVGGLLWPTVVIPPDLDESLTPKQLTWVLLHELAHIRRGDLWVVVIQRAVQAVFFFNPAVHLANWIIDELREYACDDAALAACKTSRRDCGEGFMAIIERSIEQMPLAAPALGLFESRMQIRRRLLRILDSHRTIHSGLSLRAAVSLLGLAFFVLLCGRPGDVLARPAKRLPEPRPEMVMTEPIAAVLNEPASYRPGLVWRRETQGRPGAKAVPESRGRAVTLALAYSPDGRVVASAGDDAVVELRDVATGRVTRRLLGHHDAVSCLAFSPDGRTLATGSYDRTVKLWNVASGREQLTLTGHTNWIFAVAFAPDGASLASAGHDKTVRIWNAATGRPTAALAGHSASVRALAFAPESGGWMLASGGSDSVVLIWDLRARSVRTRLAAHQGTVRALAFAPDGTTLATGAEDGEVRLWDATSGRERAALLGHSDMVTCLAFSPLGKMLATGSLDTTLKLWDTSTGRERASLQGHLDGISALAFAPNAGQMATGGFDGSVRLWEPAAPMFSPAACLAYSGEACRLAFSHDSRSLRAASLAGVARWDVLTGSPKGAVTKGAATVIATAPDGATYATGGPGGEVRLVDAVSEQMITKFSGHKGAVRSIAYSPDSRILATGDRHGIVRLWDVTGRRPFGSFPPQAISIACVQFSPDGRTIAAATGDEENRALTAVIFWDVAGRTEKGALSGPSLGFASVAFSPDGTTIATGGADGLVRLWDAVTHVARNTLKYGPCHSVAFSPDGRTLASAHEDGDLVLWDAKGGEQRGLLKGHRGPVTEVVFAPDGRCLATSSKDGTVKLWNLTTRRQTARATLKGDLTPVWAVAYSPDGRTLAVADGPQNTPGTVTLWDVATRKVKATLDGHERGVATVVFSPDGTTFASGSWDGTIRIWDARTLEPRHVLADISCVTELAFSPDSRLLASAGEGDIVTLWDVATGGEEARLTGFELAVQCVAFSPDGRFLATGGGDNRPDTKGEVKLWDVAQQSLVATFDGHTRAVLSIAFSPDGSELATGSIDETIRIWDVACRRERMMLGGLSNCAQALAYSRDGRRLAWSGRKDGLVSLHDTKSGAEIMRFVGHSDVVFGIAFAPDGNGLATGGYDRTIKLWDAPAIGPSLSAALSGKPLGSPR
jgi:WD40 repeat protein/beta-lactamase regulating signal transducer with metallopeptidase domain